MIKIDTLWYSILTRNELIEKFNNLPEINQNQLFDDELQNFLENGDDAIIKQYSEFEDLCSRYVLILNQNNPNDLKSSVINRLTLIFNAIKSKEGYKFHCIALENQIINIIKGEEKLITIKQIGPDELSIVTEDLMGKGDLSYSLQRISDSGTEIIPKNSNFTQAASAILFTLLQSHGVFVWKRTYSPLKMLLVNISGINARFLTNHFKDDIRSVLNIDKISVKSSKDIFKLLTKMRETLKKEHESIFKSDIES